MRHTASFALISAIVKALRQPERHRNWNSQRMAKKFASEKWVSFTELSDELEAQDPRFYAISELMEEAFQTFEIPLQWAGGRPRNHHSAAMLYRAVSATEAAAFVIKLERLGFELDPAPFVDAVKDELLGQSRLTQTELDVVFFGKTRSREKIRLSTVPPVVLGAKETFKTSRGYTVAVEWGSDRVALNVRGPKFRPRQPPVETKCDFCGLTYLKGDLESATQHRVNHLRHKRVYEPTPDARLADRLTVDSFADRVDQQAPKWMHHEAYERARMFKREMRYDNTQWESPPAQGRPTEDGIAYLLHTAEAPAVIVGACAFRERDNGWTLDWAWIAPMWRRRGVLARYWPRFVGVYGDFLLEFPVSDAMRAVVLKHGTKAQISEMQRQLALITG